MELKPVGLSRVRRLGAIAGLETLLVLPATLLLSAELVRQLQPPGREPARTIGLIAQWGLGHATPLSASIVLLVMPVLALGLGTVTLWRRWAADEQMRSDTVTLVSLIRRQAVALILLASALIAGAILAAVAVHVITD